MAYSSRSKNPPFHPFQHSLAIVHSRRSFGRSFVTVYVDGQLSHQATIKYPVTDVSKTFACEGLNLKKLFFI